GWPSGRGAAQWPPSGAGSGDAASNRSATWRQRNRPAARRRGATMSRDRVRSGLFPASILAALLLGLLPFPAAAAAFKPYWLALVLVYWLLEAPERAGLGVAFVVGLLADLLYGTLLGEQALRLTMLAFIVLRFRARLRFFPLWQQA